MGRPATFLFALAGSLVGAPLLANTAPAVPGAPAEQPAAAPAKKEKLVCVRERELGSNLSTKTCMTEAQWRAQRQQTREQKDERSPD